MTAFHDTPADPKELRSAGLALLRTAYRLDKGLPSRPTVRMQDVVVAASVSSGLGPAAITGPCRERTLFRIRAECMRILHDEHGYSLTQIGNHFSGRDHSSVWHAVRRARTWKQLEAAE